ncbi:RNA-binding protein pop5 [Candidozyma auris]|uniref:Ribonuclease P/MRP protein subunit POP5 n=1 Tax=Candidozyma auris TaxID=498019 RepID=A0A2H0ZGL9_CANAR|nr:hypothetical protein QG37_07446 [[Candida] auris]PIS49780.1 hypothetical protein B9J08_004807 [[Candida] auris]
MVRLKHRYILFDILYPPVSDPRTGTQREKFSTFCNNPKDTLLTLHAPSPASINSKSIANILRNAVAEHYGEIAAGGVGNSIIVKYFSNKTSTGIIRCSRQDFQQVMAAIALVTKVDNYDALMRCVHVSGTIRKCEQFSIRRNKSLIIQLGRDNEMVNGLNEFVEMFKDSGKDSDEE